MYSAQCKTCGKTFYDRAPGLAERQLLVHVHDDVSKDRVGPLDSLLKVVSRIASQKPFQNRAITRNRKAQLQA